MCPEPKVSRARISSWDPPALYFASLSFDLEVNFERSRLGILGYGTGRRGSVPLPPTTLLPWAVAESHLHDGVKGRGLVKTVQNLGSWLCFESLCNFFFFF